MGRPASAGPGTLATIAPGNATPQTGSRVLGCQAFASSSTWPVIRGTVPDAQVYDDKGRVVEKYEPAFARGWDYQFLGTGPGVHAEMRYDPRGNLISTRKHSLGGAGRSCTPDLNSMMKPAVAHSSCRVWAASS